MKEVRIFSWCDPCDDEDGARVEGETTQPLSLDPARPARTLEMCERHRKALIDPLSDLLAARGATPEKAVVLPSVSKPSGTVYNLRDWPCPLCKKVMRQGSAVTHIWGVHGNGKQPPAEPTTCPECSWPHDNRTVRPQSVRLHRARMHPESSAIADALAAVQA